MPLLLLAHSYVRGVDGLSIPLATYSYPEIARMLSTESLHVEVAGTLKERGALLGIQNRSQFEAITLVCRGLDLATEQISPNHYRLVPDPKVEQREKKWRFGLLDSLLARWKNYRNTMHTLGEMSPAQLQARVNKLASKPNADRSPEWPGLQMMLQFPAYAKVGMLMTEAVKSQLPKEVLTDGMVRSEIQVYIPPELVKEIQDHVKSVGISRLRNPLILQWFFARKTGSLTLRSDFFSSAEDGRLHAMASPVQFLTVSSLTSGQPRDLFTNLVKGDKGNSVPSLGEDAPAWLAASDANTEKAANEPGTDEAFKIPNFENALSVVVQCWAEKNRRDVVMELSPMGEPLDGTERFGVNPTATTPYSLKQATAADDSWGMELSDNALIVRNRMAFLDHVRECPVGTIAHFIRISKGKACLPYGFDYDRIEASPGFPRLDDLKPLIQPYLDGSGRTPTWFGYSGYRSGLSDTFLGSRPILLWPGLPGAVRRKISDTKEGEVKIPLADYDTRSVETLAFCCLNGDHGVEHQAEVLSGVRRGTLTVQWRHVAGAEISIRLRLDDLPDGLTYLPISAFSVPEKF